ncbi:MAG: GNAT family N-acetyltransferase [Brevinema sp.]
MKEFLFESPRLGFRFWELEDADFYASMLADPDVMRFFEKTLSRDEARGEMFYKDGQLRDNGFGFWAVEHKESGNLIGQIGLQNIPLDIYCVPAIEIGWRLHKDFWHQGFATEGAERLLNFAKEQEISDSIVAYTAKINLPSQRVMERLGMTFESEFKHPDFETKHRLSNHVLYRINL